MPKISHHPARLVLATAILALAPLSGCDTTVEQPPAEERVLLQSSDEVLVRFGIAEYEVLADHEVEGPELVSSFRAYDTEGEAVADYSVTLVEQGVRFSVSQDGETWSAEMLSEEDGADSGLASVSYAWSLDRGGQEVYTKRAQFFGTADEFVWASFELNGEELSAPLPLAEEFTQDVEQASRESGAYRAIETPLASLAEALRTDPALAPYIPFMLRPLDSEGSGGREVDHYGGLARCSAMVACLGAPTIAIWAAPGCVLAGWGCGVYIGENVPW